MRWGGGMLLGLQWVERSVDGGWHLYGALEKLRTALDLIHSDRGIRKSAQSIYSGSSCLCPGYLGSFEMLLAAKPRHFVQVACFTG